MRKLILILLVSLGVEANADAVSESLEEAMGECVSRNSARIGSPLTNHDLWSGVIAKYTSFSFSMIKLYGTDDDLVDAMISRTRDTLIPDLEDTGLKGFRSQLIEMLEYCMPFAVIAAVEESERQANMLCPDNTDYIKAVEIVTSTQDELRNRFGNNTEAILDLQQGLIKFEFKVFQEIFRYGRDDYPEFKGNGAILSVHEALTKIDLEDLESIQPFVVQALEGVRNVDDKSERLVELERELICIQDWLDVYPAHAISRLSGNN